jgi:hypothetical protein
LSPQNDLREAQEKLNGSTADAVIESLRSFRVASSTLNAQRGEAWQEMSDRPDAESQHKIPSDGGSD